MSETASQVLPAAVCIACGGRGTWHAARQDLVCQSCGTTITAAAGASSPIDSFALLPRLRDRPDSGRDWQPRATHLRCRSCQSLVNYDEHIVGRVCEACGTPALVPCDATGAPVFPSGVLPFRITEAEARARLTQALAAGHLFRRRGKRSPIESVRAVYVPCWIFSAKIFCRWRGEKQETDREGQTRRVGIDGVVDRAFTDFIVPAARSIPAALLNSIGPFALADMSGYDTRYLAGSSVEIYGTNMWDAWDEASGRMQAEVDAQLGSDSGCWPSQLETWPEWSEQRCTHVLVPAYVMSCREGRHLYQGIVNGATGKTASAQPPDRTVTIVLVVIALAILAAVGYGVAWIVRSLI